MLMMKKLFYILFLVSITATSQTDTLKLQEQFLKQYELATKNAPQLSHVNACIETSEALYQAKQDKTNISLYLANLYYTKATKFKTEPKNTVGLKPRGEITEAEKRAALSEAIKYYSYFVEHYKSRDDIYRSAQNALASLK